MIPYLPWLERVFSTDSKCLLLNFAMSNEEKVKKEVTECSGANTVEILRTPQQLIYSNQHFFEKRNALCSCVSFPVCLSLHYRASS